MKKGLLFLCLCFVNVSLMTAQELDNEVRKAVNELSTKAGRRLDVSIGAMTLQGTEVTSALSNYLYNTVRHYASNNYLFQVIQATRGEPTKRQSDNQKGTITGNFAERGNMVEINLYLVRDTDGMNIGSSRFTVPKEELNRLGIAIEPENMKAVHEREQIFNALGSGVTGQTNTPPGVNQASQNIQIQAWFDKESRTYLHRDALELTVWADKDCFFKVIHIDVNNQMRMIFPHKDDGNNNLRANTPRKLFENKENSVRYLLYGPYGTEDILIVASTEQFRNIEQDKIAPLRPATTQNIRAAVSRGGDLEAPGRPISFTGQGEVRYSIEIIKPHEEYRYSKPDMKETVEAIRREAGDQFKDGNEQSGYYIVNSIRVSYRLPRDEPDKIEFAIYYLDSYTGGSNSGGQTRGPSTQSFSFNRPANMSQAVQSVRSGINESGGTFDGNEDRGSFSAKGIAGQYQVTNLVYVTITKKPPHIPIFAIKKEVENYFGVR